MKTSIQGTVLTAACLLLASSSQSHAIEGLQLSLQCSNVVLSWPCLDDGSESFIVQYRRTLDPSTPWQILTSSLYAQSGTNMTYFVHENVVTNADCGGGDSFAAMGSEDSSTKELTYFDWGVPLATPADGTGGIVPLAIYPPSFDLSSLLIFDPAISDWLKGSEYSRDNYVMRDGPEDGPPPPPGGGGGGGGVMGSPETGFYRVVRVGPHLLGVTNGMVFSDVWEIPVEVGSPAGELVTVTLTENGSPIADSAIHVSPLRIACSRHDTGHNTNEQRHSPNCRYCPMANRWNQ